MTNFNRVMREIRSLIVMVLVGSASLPALVGIASPNRDSATII